MEFVAVPPKLFCFSIRTTFAPNRAARIAANTPVQLPPKTQTSASAKTGKDRAGSFITIFEVSPALALVAILPAKTPLHVNPNTDDLRKSLRLLEFIIPPQTLKLRTKN
jgi:hypothetical protein